MKYHLVVQFAGGSDEDLRALIRAEDILSAKLGDIADVDGHDIGSGEMNIFVITSDPKEVFSRIRELLAVNPLMSTMKAAYREAAGNPYIIVWPDNLTRFSVR
jgi:hypothetical protein